MTLKAIRLKRKLTQAQLADRAGLSQSTIAQLETGERKYSLRSLKAVAKALRIKPSALLADG